MIITSSYKNGTNPGKFVNTLGKYFYKHLDGAFSFEKSSNMFDVYTVILYQAPIEVIQKYGLEGKQADTNEAVIDINITTYQNKIRINFIMQDPEEFTLGHRVFNLEKSKDMEFIRDESMLYLKKRLEKYYEGFDFLF